VNTDFISENLEDLRPSVPDEQKPIHFVWYASAIWVFLDLMFYTVQLAGEAFLITVLVDRFLHSSRVNLSIFPGGCRYIRSSGLSLRTEFDHDASILRYWIMNITAVYEPQTHILHTFNPAPGENFEIASSSPKYLRLVDEANVRPDNVGVEETPSHISLMPGVIERVFISCGDEVKSGQAVLTLIAMKMEYAVHAKSQAIVDLISVAPGDTILKAQTLINLKPLESEGFLTGLFSCLGESNCSDY
ncbi:unnamed protein product, partial [Calicophoron daubneyi]